jgi:hypothetical protein
VAIIDGQSVKTIERGGVRGFDGYKKVKGRKRHLAVDTPGLPFAGRVEPADVSDRVAGRRLLGGLRFAFFPKLHTIIAAIRLMLNRLAPA